MLATITTDRDGRLTDESTLTVNGVTMPVPSHTSNAGRLAAARILKALADAGYRPANGYYTDLDSSHDGYVTVNVVPKEGS